MNYTIRLRSFLLSWDLIAAIILTFTVSAYLYLYNITSEQAKEIFSTGTTVLSIIFSVFFAAIAVLIAAGDNEFVYFLTQIDVYRSILWTFKVTLVSLFLALGLSITLYLITLFYDSRVNLPIFMEYCISFFAFFASYALFAAANSSLDAIKYAEYRAQFVEITHNDNSTLDSQLN